MFPERRVQPQFRIGKHLAAAALAAIIVLVGSALSRIPDRLELGRRVATLYFEPVGFDSTEWGPFRLAGAWHVTGDDPRFGGVSALAIDGSDLVAVSDMGAVVRFPKAFADRARAVVSDVPGGPGPGHFKVQRDAESLAHDPQGRGWWVGFEHGNELWLFDHAFDRSLERIRFGRHRWPSNLGLEGALADGRSLLLFPENGREMVRLDDGVSRTFAIANSQGSVSEAARLPDGTMLVIQRNISPLGFRSALVELRRVGKGYRLQGRVELPLEWRDNPEGLAAEQLPNGAIRLWIMTDDNQQPPLRTLLIALDIPARSGGN